MSVRFLLGASGSGKSRQIYNEIIQASIKEPERNFYLIVPEQYTMEAQRELVTMHPAGGMMNIDAIGMNRLAYRVFDELGISTGQVLEDFGKSMLIKKILCEQQDTLQVYGSYYDKLGFVDEMKSMMSEIFQYNIKQDTIDEILQLLSPGYIKGITLLGGEPMEHVNQQGLLPLLRQIREKLPDKTVWCFTGYDYEKDVLGRMVSEWEETKEFLSYLDVLVDGEFKIEQKDLGLIFKGSANQRTILVQESLAAGHIVYWNPQNP